MPTTIITLITSLRTVSSGTSPPIWDSQIKNASILQQSMHTYSCTIDNYTAHEETSGFNIKSSEKALDEYQGSH